MLARGMPKMKALVAISRKILRIIFALARDNTVMSIIIVINIIFK